MAGRALVICHASRRARPHVRARTRAAPGHGGIRLPQWIGRGHKLFRLFHRPAIDDKKGVKLWTSSLALADQLRSKMTLRPAGPRSPKLTKTSNLPSFT